MEPDVYAYLDDIVIVNEKCEFGGLTLLYLDFLVNQMGLQGDTDKVEHFFSYTAPRTIRQLKRFLDMASWYRRFTPDFATDAKPLNKLLRTNVPWEWGTEQESAFPKL
ncbi:uncharacterized mitochondrial protein AtMg00860-like [Belonocnema kinseyi]|uniref:uncharacterized mitochondrial protein AtMg00860-like n=1 Tax=Belonocnema kinseyi TaxID=2817044 RepID=UPI00143D9D38|nr:uncharacterized mitochondrial protein AtMg00860-like [Belonocnema kinseyi]